MPVAVALGSIPSIFFLVALPVVLLQHRYHPVLAVSSVLPVLVLLVLHVVPPESDWMWTFLTLVCVYHALVAAGLNKMDAPDFRQRLLIPLIILGAVSVWALGYLVSTGVGTIVLLLGLWRFYLHSFFDRIGRTFA
jgi:hypothetical protein